MENKIIIPNIYEQQIILTCKGHNKNKDVIEAIRNIIAQCCKVKIMYIDDNCIYHWLLKDVRKYASNKEIDFILDELFKWASTVTIKNFIYSLIGVLANISILNDNGEELIHLEINEDILNWKEKVGNIC